MISKRIHRTQARRLSFLILALAICLASEGFGKLDARAEFDRGDSFFRQGRYATARMAYKAATRMKPDHWQAWEQLGITCKKLGRLQEAIQAFEKAIAINPRDKTLDWHLWDATKKLSKPINIPMPKVKFFRQTDHKGPHIGVGLGGGYGFVRGTKRFDRLGPGDEWPGIALNLQIGYGVTKNIILLLKTHSLYRNGNYLVNPLLGVQSIELYSGTVKAYFWQGTHQFAISAGIGSAWTKTFFMKNSKLQYQRDTGMGLSAGLTYVIFPHLEMEVLAMVGFPKIVIGSKEAAGRFWGGILNINFVLF